MVILPAIGMNNREFPHLKTHVKHVTRVYCLTCIGGRTRTHVYMYTCQTIDMCDMCLRCGNSLRIRMKMTRVEFVMVRLQDDSIILSSDLLSCWNKTQHPYVLDRVQGCLPYCFRGRGSPRGSNRGDIRVPYRT